MNDITAVMFSLYLFLHNRLRGLVAALEFQVVRCFLMLKILPEIFYLDTATNENKVNQDVTIYLFVEKLLLFVRVPSSSYFHACLVYF